MALADIEQYVIDKVRAKRLELDWTQEDLSAASGLSQGFIGDVESGKRGKNTTLSTSISLLKCLNALLKISCLTIRFEQNIKQ